MIESEQDWRFEIKFVYKRYAYEALKTTLHAMSLPIRPLHPTRVVQSIYVDNGDSKAVQDNLAGVSDRQKFRFRWYGSDATQAQGTMECKIRQAGLGRKEHAPIKNPIKIDRQTPQQFMTDLLSELPLTWTHHLAGKQPVQWVRYTRDYFRCGDGRVRMTIDRDLRCARLQHHTELSLSHAHPLSNFLVVECKANQADEDLLRQVVYQLPGGIGKCSKYVLSARPDMRPEAIEWL